MAVIRLYAVDERSRVGDEMAAKTGITTIKQFTYRDDPTEEWGNTYHFDVPPPSTSANWKILADALIAEEVKCFASTSRVIRAYGYDSDDAHAASVWSYDYLVAGTPSPGTIVPPGGGAKVAGDQAGVFWAKLPVMNSKGKPIYLRKYFHDCYVSTTDIDKLHANQKGYYETFAGKLVGGTIAVLGHWVARTHPDVPISSGADQWITTRTLKRRGKRPLATP